MAMELNISLNQIQGMAKKALGGISYNYNESSTGDFFPEENLVVG